MTKKRSFRTQEQADAGRRKQLSIGEIPVQDTEDIAKYVYESRITAWTARNGVLPDANSPWFDISIGRPNAARLGAQAENVYSRFRKLFHREPRVGDASC
jgi:hypothetical protein